MLIFCFKKYIIVYNITNYKFSLLSFRFLIKQIWKVVSIILYRTLQKKTTTCRILKRSSCKVADQHQTAKKCKWYKNCSINLIKFYVFYKFLSTNFYRSFYKIFKKTINIIK